MRSIKYVLIPAMPEQNSTPPVSPARHWLQRKRVFQVYYFNLTLAILLMVLAYCYRVVGLKALTRGDNEQDMQTAAVLNTDK